MKTRTLGRSGLEVSAPGLGCMGVGWSYTPLSNRGEMASHSPAEPPRLVASAPVDIWPLGPEGDVVETRPRS